MSQPPAPPTDPALAALALALAGYCERRRAVLAVAESCTGGWVAKCCTDLAGSSAWFSTGYVTYSNAAKSALLGVAPALLGEFGAVSEPVVRAMAEAAVERSGADLSVAISGIAGPTGGSADKPVGTVWFAWSERDGAQCQTRTRLCHFAGDRDTVRRQAVAVALAGLVAP